MYVYIYIYKLYASIPQSLDERLFSLFAMLGGSSAGRPWESHRGRGDHLRGEVRRLWWPFIVENHGKAIGKPWENHRNMVVLDGDIHGMS